MSPLGQPLSARELAVLRHMSGGHSNGQIGRAMHLSEDTVKTHARRLFAKLGARDRAHAVHLGHTHGLLPDPGQPAAPTPPPSRAAGGVAPPAPPVDARIELRDCSHHVELCTYAFFPGALNPTVARDRAREGLRRLLGSVNGS